MATLALAEQSLRSIYHLLLIPLPSSISVEKATSSHLNCPGWTIMMKSMPEVRSHIKSFTIRDLSFS